MARTITDTLSYPACERRWAGASARQRHANVVRLAPNTILVNRRDQYGDGAYAVHFHGTDILTFHADGSVTYDTGGHRTVTTKERMNRYGPASIYIERGEWRVRYPRHDGIYEDHAYSDGFTHDGIDHISPEWMTSTVAALVRQGSDLAPILADALEEAGCTNDGLLARLRGPDAQVSRFAFRAVAAQLL